MKNKKSLIRLIIIIIILALLLGMSYAFYLARITKNTEDTSVSMLSKDLQIVYISGTNNLINTDDYLSPGNFSSSMTFTVSNTGTDDIDEYGVVLEDFSISYIRDKVLDDGTSVSANQLTEFVYPNDLEMQIVCKEYYLDEYDADSSGNQSIGDCAGKQLSKSLPTSNDLLVVNSIKSNVIQVYNISIDYIDSGIDQSLDKNKRIEGKVNIIDLNNTIDISGTVTDYNVGDYVVISNGTKEFVSSIKSDGSYKVVGVEPGDYSISVKYKEKDEEGNVVGEVERFSKTFKIIKRNSSNIISNVIYMNDNSRLVNIDISSTSINVGEIIDIEFYRTDTLPYTLLNDSRVVINDTVPDFNSIETEEVGLFKTEDDYGTSYYYRGKQSYNYVNFAGFTWRVVRINGDGSIRLVLNGTLDLIKREGLDTVAGTTSSYNSSATDHAHVGYMYGFTGITGDGCLITVDGVKSLGTQTSQSSCKTDGGEWKTAYELTHMNLNDSTIKQKVDLFYETYIENGDEYQYSKYLADTIFCVDKTLSSGLGYGKVNNDKDSSDYNISAFITNTRITETKNNPTLMCAQNSDNSISNSSSSLYSRYTVKPYDLSNGTKTNGDLKYPIGLLTVDEVAFAGGKMATTGEETTNLSYYLGDAANDGILHYLYWLSTPKSTGVKNKALLYMAGTKQGDTEKDSITYTMLDGGIGIRPVINLRYDVSATSGDGTKANPYVIG